MVNKDGEQLWKMAAVVMADDRYVRTSSQTMHICLVLVHSLHWRWSWASAGSAAVQHEVFTYSASL